MSHSKAIIARRMLAERVGDIDQGFRSCAVLLRDRTRIHWLSTQAQGAMPGARETADCRFQGES